MGSALFLIQENGVSSIFGLITTLFNSKIELTPFSVKGKAIEGKHIEENIEDYCNPTR
jgi:hypothetical protein